MRSSIKCSDWRRYLEATLLEPRRPLYELFGGMAHGSQLLLRYLSLYLSRSTDYEGVVRKLGPIKYDGVGGDEAILSQYGPV